MTILAIYPEPDDDLLTPTELALGYGDEEPDARAVCWVLIGERPVVYAACASVDEALGLVRELLRHNPQPVVRLDLKSR